jgi:hypothetical protein
MSLLLPGKWMSVGGAFGATIALGVGIYQEYFCEHQVVGCDSPEQVLKRPWQAGTLQHV